MPFPVTLRLVPKNIVLGIGCKRATNCETIERAVRSALDSAGIAFERVICAATIDLKSNEAGLLGFCEKYGLKLHFFTAQMLMEADGDFTSSDFVKSITGVDNVCERSAVKCSGGRLIMRKTAAGGVTVAAAEKLMTLDFERKVL
jgi:cobalt-precorrin 5A hydrolase